MKRLLVLLVLVLVLTSCATLQKWWNPTPIEKLRIGQTTEQVLEFFRRPVRINTTVAGGVRRKQWVYDLDYKVVYLYFSNGKLTAWQY